MEKIGLFDLIDKFSTVASGKNEFNKKTSAAPTPKEEDTKSQFIDPQILPPQYYLMNAKLIDFCVKHNDFAKKVKR